MLIDTDKLIGGYYDTIKEQYPELSLEQVATICRSPFKFLKLQMQQVWLPEIRFKYFGVFLVKEKRIANAGRIAQQALEIGKIKPAKYEKIQLLIQKNDESKS